MRRAIFLSLLFPFLSLYSYAQAPGDSIGFSFYDYLTNGSPTRNLINYGDGTFSFARTAAIDSATNTRGTYFTYYDGSSWTPFWSRIEIGRVGLATIDEFKDAGGAELVATSFETNVDAVKGANVWSGSPFPCGTSPRIAIDEGFTVHAVTSGGGYHYSADAGATWNCDAATFDFGLDADSYDIAVLGDHIAVVSAAAGDDVVLFESSDAGVTWNETTIYDIDETGGTEGDEPADGSCALIFDSNGNLHAAWGSYLYDGSGSFVQSTDAGIRHWSEASGVQEVAWPDPDTSIVDPGGRDGNLASQPDLCADDHGTVAIIFSRFIEEQDSFGHNYEHIFGVTSISGGHNWFEAFDLTPGNGFDAAWPSVADLCDDDIHFVYTSDRYAGNWLQGIHPQVAVAYMYRSVRTLPYIEGVAEGSLPAEVALLQNYPNPFNGISDFGFQIADLADVSLTIYDVLGREVATLVNERLAPGVYRRRWDATGQPSGVYFYRLSAGSYVETKKLVLLR